MTLRDSFKAILLFLWKVLSFSLASVGSLCLDRAHLYFLGEKSAATMLYFHGVCCKSNHHPSQLPGSCYTLPSWAGSAGSAGAACGQLAWSPAYGSPDSLHPSEALLQEHLRGSYLRGCSVLDRCKTSDFMLPAHHHPLET